MGGLGLVLVLCVQSSALNRGNSINSQEARNPLVGVEGMSQELTLLSEVSAAARHGSCRAVRQTQPICRAVFCVPRFECYFRSWEGEYRVTER